MGLVLGCEPQMSLQILFRRLIGRRGGVLDEQCLCGANEVAAKPRQADGKIGILHTPQVGVEAARCCEGRASSE